ncbi:ester cyclase [Sulfurospirillum arcachonense]|uniref:ester cyclase n=1 Tax=Sulfurospirillum arcachonense TaxID=57666 RepID=UPI000468AC68|nr:ester cyclase [Sulfurospirillum arcachonense]
MEIKSNKELVRLYYEELWNEKKLEYIDILFDDNITFRGSMNIETKGKDGFLQYLNNVAAGIPDLYHGVEVMVCEKDRIAARAIYNGRHSGKLFGLEPTGKTIRFNGASSFKFKDGKIVDIWVLGDLMNLQKQLNVLDMRNVM